MAASILRIQPLAQQTKTLILAIVGILSIIYLAQKILAIQDISFGDGLDFRYIWLAGKIWASGHNPYGPIFAQVDREYFHQVLGGFWVYPPYWYPIALALGFFSFHIATVVWKISNLLLLLGATHLIARALADVSHQNYFTLFLTGIAYVCFMQATAVTIFIGQTSVITYFGFGALIFGILKARPFFITTGLVFLALKPQIGIVGFFAVIALNRYRWTLIPATAVCLLATTPIAISSDCIVTVKTFLSNLTRYSESYSNTPSNMIGLINISSYILPNSLLSSLTLIFIMAAIIFAIVIFYYSNSNKDASELDPEYLVFSLALLVASSFFFLPLHSYDIVGLGALLMMTIAISFMGRFLMVLGLVICFRPRNLLDAFGVANFPELIFPESHLVSGGIFLIFIGTLWTILTCRRNAKPLGGSTSHN